MWPEDQRPGEQSQGHPGHQQPQPPNPQGPAPGYGYPQQPQPPQQPGFGPPAYGQPGYGQPGYGHQPAYGQQPVYGQYPGFGPAPQWGAPVPPPAPPGPGSRRGPVIGLAIAAAVVLLAGAAGAAVLLGGHDGQRTVANPNSSATATSAPSAESSGSDATAPNDGFNGDPHSSNAGTKPVVPGWKAVARGDRQVAFDIPQDWTALSSGTDIGFEDPNGNPEVEMGGPAEYKQNWCQDNSLAAAGTKGAVGAKSVQDAAETQAASWAYYGFTDLKSGKKGTLRATKPVPFTNGHGIKGYAASATETGVRRTNPCSTDGAAYAVAWVGADNTLTVWVLYTATGVPGQVPASTITAMENSIRQIQ
ncbi:hypothetical protein NGB36_04830 [Streptomyces sp. RB6PN25]|uniref:DUF8017 domain-containing protein n=1 Tax=Streptomyces humicola TaxID=2953240 RepID=A0ABT1PQI5_9ACTN|nr:hypothetical protein [Streptomyces humicola]MCQ4079933.1 hypothetical protein [Streptomyces humicola]